MKRLIASVITTVLLCFCAVGTTYAWLVAKTEPVKSTFTAGNISIMLSESTSRNPRMVPGAYLKEDPNVTVFADSEDCWLFVKAEKSANFDTFLEMSVNDGWTMLDGHPGVSYRRVDSMAVDQKFEFLKALKIDNEGTADEVKYQIYVKGEITKAEYDTLGEGSYPTVTFTAYAVQRLGFDTPEAAWEEAQKLG